MNNELHTTEKNVLNDPELDAIVVAYGRKAYAQLLKQGSDEEISKEAIKAVLTEIYTGMKEADSTDPLEAMMYSQAQKFQNEYLKDMADNEPEAASNDIIPDDRVEESESTEDAPSTENETSEDTAPDQQTEPETRPQIMPDAENDREAHHQRKGGARSNLKIAMLILGIIVMLWFVVGIAVGTGLIYGPDLGYEWFNENITWFF